MKVFTQVGQKDHDQVKPENINDNTRVVIGEYNGRLNGQNFPVGTIDKFKLAPPTLTNQTTINCTRFKHVGQTQDYHFTRRWNTYEGGIDINLPLYSFNLNNDAWSSGWNNLSDISNDFNLLVLEFEAESGTVHGCFDINFRHGFDLMLDKSNNIKVFSTKWWTRWGIFCNDVLIAETGRCFPRLENLSVPYKLFVGSQPIRLELKWQTINTNPIDELEVSTTPRSFLEIYGASIWACNTKR
jgi:hypothetical protein